MLPMHNNNYWSEWRDEDYLAKENLINTIRENKSPCLKEMQMSAGFVRDLWLVFMDSAKSKYIVFATNFELLEVGGSRGTGCDIFMRRCSPRTSQEVRRGRTNYWGLWTSFMRLSIIQIWPLVCATDIFDIQKIQIVTARSQLFR